MTKVSPNDKCICGSGTKFKKCCGPRGGLNEIDYAEVQAYKEQRERDYVARRNNPRRAGAGAAMMLMHFASMGSMHLPYEQPTRPSIKSR